MSLKPIVQKQFLVLVDKLPATFWTKCTSPKKKKDETEYNDGQTGVTRKVLGFASFDNVTLSKPFDPEADKAVTDFIGAREKEAGNDEKFTISIQPVRNDYQGNTLKGVTITLTGCQLVSSTCPEVDRMGSSVAMLEMEVCYDDISFG